VSERRILLPHVRELQGESGESWYVVWKQKRASKRWPFS
jgi:hypothetical protein